MKFIIGAIISVAGICGGCYVGLYLCMYGGLVAIFNAIQSGTGSDFALGVFRLVCTGPSIALLGWIPFLLGLAIMGAKTSSSYKFRNYR
jgi:hypothetical protein